MPDDREPPGIGSYDSGAVSTVKGSIYEPVHGKRQVRYYLVSAHELASISVTSGGASFLLTLGIFLLGVAATAFYGAVTAFSGITGVIAAILGVVFVGAAGLLLFVRHTDVARIKDETHFNGS